MAADQQQTSTEQPRRLVEALSRAEDDGAAAATEEQRRKFRRFVVRGEAVLEPLDPDAMTPPATVPLRNVSYSGASFLTSRPMDLRSTWRLRFRMGGEGELVGAQPLFICYCRKIHTDLYLVGGQFILEPYILRLLGVPAEVLRWEGLYTYSDQEAAQFESPDSLLT